VEPARGASGPPGRDRRSLGRGPARGGLDELLHGLQPAEVRDYFLAVLGELVDRYGDVIDGIQLDWMRFPRHSRDRPTKCGTSADCLTQFTSRARSIVRGGRRPLRLAARVPTSVAGCRHLGAGRAAVDATGLG